MCQFRYDMSPIIDWFCHWFFSEVYHFVSIQVRHVTPIIDWLFLENSIFPQKSKLLLCRQFQPWASTVGVTSTQYLGIKNLKLQNLKIFRSNTLLQVCSLIFHQNGQRDNMARFRAWRKYLWWNTEVSFEIQLLYQFLYSCIKCSLRVLNCNL